MDDMNLEGPELSSFAKRKAFRIANEIAQRRIEALNLYVPQPTQEDFHKCDAPECMLMGGNRGGNHSQRLLKWLVQSRAKILMTSTQSETAF